MKNILLYPCRWDGWTRRILAIGSATAILFLISGFIIYQLAPNFNHFLQAFRVGDDLMAAGRGFVICTLLSAAICEMSMHRVHKEEK